MAVSGNKISKFSGSVSIGSAEDFDHSCDSCLFDGQHVEAYGFCVDCNEYLCKNCFTVHKKTRSSRHHQLLDKGKIDQHGVPISHSNACTEKCSVHKDEVIKYFCPQHKKLVCHDCVILQHKDCKMDYIPEKCAGIGHSEEYQRMIWLLDMKLNAIRSVERKATVWNKDIGTWQKYLIEEIDQFENKIINYIRQRRKEIQAEVEKKKSTDRQRVQDVLDSCLDFSSKINKLHLNLQDNKTRKQNGQVYIEMKRAMSLLESDELKKAEEILDQISTQYRFVPNQDLQKMMPRQDSFGKLSLSAKLVNPEKKLDKVSKKGKIDVKTKSDQKTCLISGCAVLSSNKLLVADRNNNKLKVLDTSSNRVIEEKRLDSSPFDITTLPNDQIAVTLPKKIEILIMRSDSQLSAINTIQVKGACCGISYHQGYLYVVCQFQRSVVILDTKGNVCKNITLNDDVFKYPLYIAVNEESGLIYISDWDSRSIVSMTGEGEIQAVIKDIPESRGMSILPGGSLLVCCGNDTLQHLTGDLQQHRQVIGGLNSPRSICYNQQLEEVYIGGGCDQLDVLTVKYHDD